MSVSGSAMHERMLIVTIHFDLSTPSWGIMSMGKMSATIMPLIIMVET